MSSLLLDLTTALRFFARRRAAFAVIIVTIALALGANTAVFSVLKAFLFAQLGTPEPERIVLVWTTTELPGRGTVNFSDAYVNYKALRDSARSFSAFSATLSADVNWEQPDNTRRLQGTRATANFFDVMRVQPALGRLFNAKEEGPNAAPVAVISHALWRSAFAADPAILGRSVRFNGAAHTIVGVLPAGFGQPQGTDVWLPFDLPQPMWTAVIGGRQLNNYARLAPGVSLAAADAELKAFAGRATEIDAQNKDWSWRAQPLREVLLNGADNAVVFIQSGAAILLLLAISNLASLLLAWAAERQRETAVRLALGASGWRLVRQFLIQSITLVSIGGALGVLLAWLSLPLLQQLNPNPQLAAFLAQLELDRTTLAFAAALVLGTGLLAGLLPALQARTTSFTEALRSESRGASASGRSLQWQQAMVVVQAAISVLILVGAGLAGIGFHKLSQVRVGFATEQRAAVRIQFPEPAYATHEQRAKLVRALEQNLAREPALASFAVISSLPVGDTQWGAGMHPQLPTGEWTRDPAVFHFRRATPSYHATMGIPLLEGRLLDERDRHGAPEVAVISKSAADKYWPGVSAVGRKLRRAAQGTLVEIVGVVGDVRDAGAGLPAGETVYMPWDQISLRRAWIVVRSRGSTEDALAAAHRALRATAPEIAPYGDAKLTDLAHQAQALPRLQITLLGVFAVIAIGITALGSYGVMSQLVANRQREIAIRAALGATQSGVLRLVLWQNARLAAIGTTLGLIAAFVVSRALQAKLTGFDASPLWPYLAVAALVLLLTQLASLIPARRAAKADVHLVLTSA